MGNGQDVRGASRAAHAMEWLIADGLGGSASGTALGLATRRTHALLTAAIESLGERSLLLGLDERVADSQGTWEFSALDHEDDAPAKPHAPAAGVIEAFKAEPFPSWRL